MKRTVIYRNGKPLSQTKVVAYIRKELRLSKNAYNKYYDITRNKLRNYERVTGAPKQSVTQFLYNRARFKARARSEGLTYTKSYKARFIEKFTSRSTGKVSYGKLELQRINKETERYTKKIYGDFIKKNDYAQKLVKEIKDPKQRLKALNEYASRRKDLALERKGEVRLSQPFEKGRRGGTNEEYDEQAYNDILEKYGGSGL